MLFDFLIINSVLRHIYQVSKPWNMTKYFSLSLIIGSPEKCVSEAAERRAITKLDPLPI